MKYPTIAEVKKAGIQALHRWERTLPPPQNDVERTVRNRVTRRLDSLLEGAAK